MNPLQNIRTIPLSDRVLRVLGWFFLIEGAVGQQIQMWLIRKAESEGTALLDLLEGSSALMTTATIAMMLSILEYLAVPIFVFLLVEGVVHTRSFRKYFLRVFALALVSQLVYMLRNTGANPAFALVMAMVMLFFFRQFGTRSIGSVLIRITAVLGCLMWSLMLSIPHGPACVLLAAALWLLKDKPYFRPFGGFAATLACSIFSPAYAAASLSFLLLHFYNGTHAPFPRWLTYAAYPAILLLPAAGILIG